MFESVVLRGGTASLLWGYRTAATLTNWRIQKKATKVQKDSAWTLTATVQQCDAFQARQRPLLFTAPRDKGRWCWEVREISIGERSLTATLGPPLQ